MLCYVWDSDWGTEERVRADMPQSVTTIVNECQCQYEYERESKVDDEYDHDHDHDHGDTIHYSTAQDCHAVPLPRTDRRANDQEKKKKKVRGKPGCGQRENSDPS
jgi:hypothetical protein